MTFKEFQLQDILDIQWGDTKTTKASYLPSGFRAYSASGPDGFLGSYDYEIEGIVLSAIGANCGSTYFATGKWSCIKNTIRIFPKNEEIDLRYFYYMTKTPDFWPIRGSAQSFISQTDVRELYVKIPDISTQRYIGSLLSVIDEKIAANLAISKTLEDIAKTIFRSWFLDFDPVEAKMAGLQLPGMDASILSLFPDSLEESELGMIPTGWKVQTLFDCGLEIESGSRPKGGVKGISFGVPSIGAESIHGVGVFDYTKTKYVPREFYEKMNKGKPRDFDVLLYKDGGKPGEFKPRVGLYGLGFPFEEFAVNEHVFVLRAKDLGSSYLYFWISMERTLDILRSRGIKAAIPGINQQDVGTIWTLKPPQNLLNAFNELVSPSISRILRNASESQTLITIKDSLMPRLISGDLKIPEEMLAS